MDTGEEEQEAVKDYGSFKHPPVDEGDIAGTKILCLTFNVCIDSEKIGKDGWLCLEDSIRCSQRLPHRRLIGFVYGANIARRIRQTKLTNPGLAPEKVLPIRQTNGLVLTWHLSTVRKYDQR